MMHLGVYCMILILLGLALLFLSESLTPVEITAMLLTISIHVPAFLTVKTQRAVFGSMLGPYPEAHVPFLVLANWILIGGLTSSVSTYFMTGLAVAVGLGICYAAVRIVAFATTKAVALVHHLPAFDKSTLAMIGKRTIYTLRVVICAVSLVTSLGVLLNERGPSLTWMLALMAALGAIAIAVATWKGTKAFCDQVGATAAAQIANSLTQSPVTALLYYSAATDSKHIAPMNLIKRLSSAGIELAVIARERGACAVLAKSQAHSAWFASTITTLDSFALQGIKAVFYVNDGVKNGHFIHFNQYHHILVATNSLGKAMTLPGNIAMYDAVVAPDAKVAACWRASVPSSLQTRIFTVSNLDDKIYLPAYAPIPAGPRIAVYVGPDDATGSTPPHLATTIPVLIDAALDCEDLHVDLVFPKTGDGLSHALQSRASSRTDMGGLRQLTGSAVMAANIADIIAVTSSTDLSILRATNKPLIWIGDGPVPSGLYPFNAGHMNRTLSAIRNKTPFKPEKTADTNISPTHFNGYPALLAHLDLISQAGIK